MDTSSNEIYSKDHYVVDNSGKLYYRQQMKEAEGFVQEPVANHAPMLQRIIRKDDGFICKEEVEFSARLNGKNESPVCVDKKTMIGNQPHVNFSPACRIYIGRGNTAKYSEFMQIQCEDAKIETVYNHTGWILNEDGERVFLNGENSIDKEGLTNAYTVELDPDFRQFRFYPVEDDVSDCFNTVIHKFTDAAPNWVQIPLLAYVFMTPLNGMFREEGKEPCFSLYLIGKTGSYKSSISKLLLCFFGGFSYATPSPVTFLDSKNAIGRKLGVGADLPLLLDDRRPTNNSTDKQIYEGTEKFVSSAIGDRAARGRLNADSSAKESYVAKSNLIVTAEEAFVNIGSSSIARSVSIELEPGSINFNGLLYLQDNPQHFNKVMQLYIQWVIKNWEWIKQSLDKLLKEYREVFSEAGHARLATAFSQMLFGYHMFLCFAKDMDQITEDEAASMLEQAKTVFLEMCDKQSKKVESEKPTLLFIELLKEMLETKTVNLVDLRKSGQDGTTPIVSTRTIGYRDDDYIYLIPQQAYKQVVQFYSESGYTFPASKTSLWKMFRDEGKLLPDVNADRPDRRKKLNNKSNRYIWLNADVLDSEEKEGKENE